MDAATLSITVAISLVLLLLAANVYIGPALGLAAILGTLVLTGELNRGLSFLLYTAVSVTSNYGYLCIPLFVLMGLFAAASGIAGDLFEANYRIVGRIPGGLAITTVIACAGLAAITGTTAGAVAAMIHIALPQMRKYNYDERLSVGVISVAGTLAIMIPPSVTFIVYAIFAEQSIGKLLIAGILPGLFLASLYSALILIRCLANPRLGPAGERFTLHQKVAGLKGVVPFLLLLATVFVGIIFGIWTPVESAAVAVVIVFAMALLRRRITRNVVLTSISQTVVTSGSIMTLVIGSLIFSKYITLTRFNEKLTNAVIGLDLSPLMLFTLLIVLYVILGMFLEPTSIIALTIPLLMPVVKAVGWNPIWFGVIIVNLMEVAAVTPPVGLVLYTVKASAPEIPLETIVWGAFPFWLCNIVACYVFYAFPALALFLPSFM